MMLTQAEHVGAGIQHAGSAFEGGSKVAFDPRDLAQDAGEEARIGGKMPRLTIMEEVLLLGIKDKQVSFYPPLLPNQPLFISNRRATSPFGTITYPMLCEAASSSSSPSAGASPSFETPTGVGSPWPSG